MPAIKRLIHAVDVEQKTKSRVNKELSTLYKDLQKPQIVTGFNKVYESVIGDATDIKPPESQKVQITAQSMLDKVKEQLSDLINATYSRDDANSGVKSNVEVDGVTIITGGTQSFLLSVEKQMKDLKDVIEKTPVLPPDKTWTFDPATNLWKTPVIQTRSETMEKIALKMADATEKHQATHTMIDKPKLTGFWNKSELSGALPQGVKDALAKKVAKVAEAVRIAREEANADTKASYKEIADPLLNFIFEPLK